MNLGTLISRAAVHFKDRCAFTCAGESRTFTEIDQNSNRIANGLLKLGLKKGERIAGGRVLSKDT